jgi:c-di-GMP-binding flagellar brake protein YcgR
MIESEQKSCTLRVTSQENKGYLYINDGELIAAETDRLSKENAVYEIISWDEPIIEIKDTLPVKEKEIFQPLMSVLMEGFRIRDEKLSETHPEITDPGKLPKFKSQATAGRRIGLEIGAKLQIEIKDFESPLESNMVGMMPDEYIIITLPSHLSLHGHELSKGAHFGIKYLYLGKVCFFQSKLLASVDFHQKMLFVSYPSVIHYHELRRHKRVPIFLPCTIGLDDGQSYQAVILDMSISGCLCQQKSKEDKPLPLPSFHIDKKLTIRFLLPGTDEEQVLTGHIRNLNKTKQETRIGVEFEENPPEVEKAITHYLSH